MDQLLALGWPGGLIGLCPTRCLALQQASLVFWHEGEKAKACRFSWGLGLDRAHHHLLRHVGQSKPPGWPSCNGVIRLGLPVGRAVKTRRTREEDLKPRLYPLYRKMWKWNSLERVPRKGHCITDEQPKHWGSSGASTLQPNEGRKQDSSRLALLTQQRPKAELHYFT